MYLLYLETVASELKPHVTQYLSASEDSVGSLQLHGG